MGRRAAVITSFVRLIGYTKAPPAVIRSTRCFRPSAMAEEESFQAKLYQSQAPTREVGVHELDSVQPTDEALLWVDLTHPTGPTLDRIWQACRFPEEARPFVDQGTNPEVRSQGEYFWLRVVAALDHDGHQVSGAVLTLVAGCNRIVSIHAAPVRFIDELHGAEGHGSALGALSAESFVAALLDWQLSTYFDAIADYEKAIETLENDILGGSGRPTLDELRRLRRWASRLRRMLAPHRAVFGALSRPDFRPSESKAAERHFGAIDTRFERAMDMVENARELVLGSFELFSSQTALQTNESMKMLTFVTVIFGGLATLAGALGMNFDAGFFKTKDVGFWVAIVGMVVLTTTGVLLGRWRKWF